MKPSATLPLLAACLVAWMTVPLAGAEPAGYTRSLFDGKTLDGWQVSQCEAVVENGNLLLKSGNGLVRTDHRYSDFVLELEWKALKEDKWDSGIYFRAEPPPKGRPWPTRYQANLLKGREGNVGGVDGATSTGLIKPGDWNHFKLTVVGTKAALAINGTPAWEADGLENATGYIGLQAEVPGGGAFLFRNIRLTELGYKSLFNGRDLTGWELVGKAGDKTWKVDDGAIICTGKGSSWLRSSKEFGDFNLRVEYKLAPAGNSGIYCRVPKNGNHHGKDSGVEVQVLEDTAPKYAKLKAYQFCGGVYDFVGPTKENRVGKPPGEWNTMEINCKGFDYRVSHNGVDIVHASAEEFPLLKERLVSGFLGLQNHSDEVRYREVRIGPPQP